MRRRPVRSVANVDHLQVHDELVLEAKSDQREAVQAMVVECMSDVMELSVNVASGGGLVGVPGASVYRPRAAPIAGCLVERHRRRAVRASDVEKKRGSETTSCCGSR